MKRTLLSLLAVSLSAMAVTRASATNVATINYDEVLSKYSYAVSLNKRLQDESQKLRDAIALKQQAREALLKQADELTGAKPAEGKEAEVKKHYDLVVAAIKQTEAEITEIQSAPALTKYATDESAKIRGKVNEAVQAALDEQGLDLVLDGSSLNAIGMKVVIRRDKSEVVDITAAVLAKLATPAPTADGGAKAMPPPLHAPSLADKPTGAPKR